VAFGGFWLLPQMGMQKSLLVAAAANLFIAVFCLVAGSSIASAKEFIAPKKPVATKESADSADPRLILGGAGVALAGAAAMICQVVWTRVATLVLGASVYSFTVVLGVFLAGLALGALFVTGACHKKPQSTGAVLQALLMGGAVAIIATGYVFSFLPAWAVGLHSAINTGAGAFSLLQLQLAIAAALLFVPVLILGGIFPAALLALARETKAIGSEVGRLYAWNIAGSVAGVLLAGFVLLPIFGVSISLGWAATLLLVAGLFYSQLNIGLSIKKGSPVALVMAVAIWLVLPPWDRQLMASGVHTYAPAYKGLVGPRQLADHVRKSQEILYYADGMTATIMVTKDRTIRDRDVLYISTDGKMDGSSDLDMPTQRLAAHLPMLMHPTPKKVAIIGMGTGCSAGSASLHPQSKVKLIEIEAKMVEGARFFLAHNHDVHNRENVDLTVSDGRLHLLMQRGVYDVVVSVPSNPWLAGSANLFTADFFARAAGALNEGGIFAQWVQTYSMSSQNFAMVVRGFVKAFPHTLMATTIPGDVLLLGSQQPFDFDLTAIGQRMNNPAIRADLADRRLQIRSVYDLMARIRVLPEFMQQLAGQGQLHTDDHPILAYRAPLDLHQDTWPQNEQLIGRFATGVAPALMAARGPDYFLTHQQTLAEAYERYLGADSKEAIYTRRALQQ
jgi:spermidine synthase